MRPQCWVVFYTIIITAVLLQVLLLYFFSFFIRQPFRRCGVYLLFNFVGVFFNIRLWRVALHSESGGTLCYVYVNNKIVIVTSCSLNCQRSTASCIATGFTIILCISMIFILIVSLASYENILYCVILYDRHKTKHSNLVLIHIVLSIL